MIEQSPVASQADFFRSSRHVRPIASMARSMAADHGVPQLIRTKPRCFPPEEKISPGTVREFLAITVNVFNQAGNR